ncbi:unnamed protein product [Somion occarium]|uniref:Uncharacterized protein n=1 Tax=Somion occarium TaxID=3059160 RepID=A0ABP1DQ25_9APHY
MSWMTPQQFQAWTTARPSQPSGWQGHWPPRAPPGPPPPPQGVDPRRWNGGQWHFNPMYRSVAPTVQSTAWAVHPGWGDVRYPSTRNPYTKQGRSDYWDTALLDNPLGLEGMDIRTDEPTFGPPRPAEEAPQTPWIWAPRSLSKSPERRERAEEPRDGHGVRDPQNSQSTQRQDRMQDQPRQRTQTQPAPVSSTRQASNSDSSRHPYNIYSNASSASQSEKKESWPRSDQVPSSAPAMISNYSQHSQQAQALASRRSNEFRHQHSHSQDVERDIRNASNSNSSELRRSGEHNSEDKSAFSSHQQLQPTFSPNIVRTPNHYVSSTVSSASAAAAAVASSKTPASSTTHTPASSRRPSGDEDVDDPSPPRTHTHGPIYAPTTPSRLNTNGRTSSSQSRTPIRQSSAPSTVSSSSTSLTTFTPLHNFSDEPASLLSPILSGTPSRGSGSSESLSRSRTSPNIGSGGPSPTRDREVSRSQTYPLISSNGPVTSSAPFPPIPEERERTPAYGSSSSSTNSRTPRPSPSRVTAPYAERSIAPKENGTSPYTSSHSREHSTSYTSSRTQEPSAAYSSASQRDRSTSHNIKSTSPYRHGTEPAPPVRKSSSDGSNGRTVSRSHTYPTLDAGPSNYSSSNATSSRIGVSPLPSPNRSRSRTSSPVRSNSLRNPLPAPPMPSPFALSLTNSVSASAAAAAQSQSHSSHAPLSRSHTQPALGSSQSSYYSSQSATPTYSSSQSMPPLVQPSYPPTQSSTAYTSSRAALPTHTSQPSQSSYSSSQTTQSSRSPSHVSQPSYSSNHTHQPPQPSQHGSYPSGSSAQQPSQPQAVYSSASQAASVSRRARDTSPNPPKTEARVVRYGYWNRRGDHLLIIPRTGRAGSPRELKYIVYAPRTQANPPELSHYPSPTEGFMDDQGRTVKYDPSIPELPESLPLHGEEPARPYESFVKYI